VPFFILSSVIFCAVHTAFATNQNWSGSSLPKPLKTGNFIVFDMLNVVVVVVVWVKVYVVEVKVEVVWVDEVFTGKPLPYQLTTLCGEACAAPSSSLRRRSNQWAIFRTCSSSIPKEFPTSRSSKHQGNGITHFSHKSILIQVFKDLKYLPRGPLKKRRSASL
jgi:hypothetical protein